MKKIGLLLAVTVVLVSSCATSGHYTTSAYQDAIYVKPGYNSTIIVEKTRDIESLQNRTVESNRAIVDGRVVEGVYATSNREVNINLEPETTYIVLNPGESFEDRLTKFDSPTYTININYNYPLSAWDYDYFYSPFYYRYWRWNTPYSWSHYNPWYGWHPYHSPYTYYRWGPYYSWDPYYSWRPYSWGYYSWNPYYHNYWYNNFYTPYYPSPSVVKGRDRYYGQRVASQTSTTPYSSSSSRINQGTVQSGSSYSRREGSTTQIRGGGAALPTTGVTGRTSESIHRRELSREATSAGSVTSQQAGNTNTNVLRGTSTRGTQSSTSTSTTTGRATTTSPVRGTTTTTSPVRSTTTTTSPVRSTTTTSTPTRVVRGTTTPQYRPSTTTSTSSSGTTGSSTTTSSTVRRGSVTTGTTTTSSTTSRSTSRGVSTSSSSSTTRSTTSSSSSSGRTSTSSSGSRSTQRR